MPFKAVLVPADESLLCQEIDLFSLYDDETIHFHIKPIEPMNVQQSLLLRPMDDIPGLYVFHEPSQSLPNKRITKLAMALGLFACRMKGNVVVARSSGDLFLHQIDVATPDLRSVILNYFGQDEAPEWATNASKQNYLDESAISMLAEVMKGNHLDRNEIDPITDHSCGSRGEESPGLTEKEYVTKTPLCLQCRRPATSLCQECDAAYFCEPPRLCRLEAWSHDCICSTWKIYTERRAMLSTFALGEWANILTKRQFQLSDVPYERFLALHGIEKSASSWWRTEMDGWCGGESDSARVVDVSIRRTYAQGFHPIVEIPLDQRPSINAWKDANATINEVGLFHLDSWDSYYTMRGIPFSSPVALLLSFPVTLYYCIQEFGSVPCTVARMLSRSLRIHIIGAEKEIHFLDLFREVAFLLPEDIGLELVFVVRDDMLPPKVSKCSQAFSFQACPNLDIFVVSGTYGASLDPRFDCGTGMPDMIIAFNAGLFAYPSWRSVIEFLHEHGNVVGVFSDYNEHSGVQCASLGGGKSRESLRVNPFRQPRAMPVYSMNLPQFCNGFLYAFNEQKLE